MAKRPGNLTACPICGARMELLSQQGKYVSAGCAACHLSLTVPEEQWAAAKAERAATGASNRKPDRRL